ncbi:hypothetical protein FT663_03704 [Candidozyma haemuli var. vulneris]|nr:hypothetical protein FT662_03840 [[Candida] haemuloni var. vulneris]KAF3989244.1 hypothetical protein FT663_03704 [[Candida] haemuloni var. vulneris]
MAEEDFHPIELAAHSLLSGPLDSLNDNFLQLHRSQHVLLTRLKMISERLDQIEKGFGEGIAGQDVTAAHQQIKAMKAKLQESQKRLGGVEKRVEGLDS